jgi:hypothetical protein
MIVVCSFYATFYGSSLAWFFLILPCLVQNNSDYYLSCFCVDLMIRSIDLFYVTRLEFIDYDTFFMLQSWLPEIY